MSVRPSVHQPSGDPYDDIKEEIHRFDVDGSAVLFRRVPIHRDPVDGILGGRRYGKSRTLLGHPGEQRRYAVEVDGLHVGWVVRRAGSGRNPYVPLAMFSGYEPGLGRNGYPDLDGRGSGTTSVDRHELSDLAPDFAEWRRIGIALTWDEIVHKVRERDEAEAVARAETDRRMAEDDLKREAEIKAREQARLDAIRGLEEIAARFDGQLTNYQMEALQKSMAHFASAGIQWHESEFLDRMSRGRSREGA